MPYIMYYDENAHCILKDGNDSINITLEHRKQKQLKNQIIQNGGNKLSVTEKQEYMENLFKYNELLEKLHNAPRNTNDDYNPITTVLFSSLMLLGIQNTINNVPDNLIYDIKYITRALEMDSNKIIENYLENTTKTLDDTNEVYKYLEQMVANLKKKEIIDYKTSKEAIFSSLFSF